MIQCLMVYWFQDHTRSKHPRIKQECVVRCVDGSAHLHKGSFVNPIRLKYLPYGHWALNQVDEKINVFCETPEGSGIVSIADIEWHR